MACGKLSQANVTAALKGSMSKCYRHLSLKEKLELTTSDGSRGEKNLKTGRRRYTRVTTGGAELYTVGNGNPRETL